MVRLLKVISHARKVAEGHEDATKHLRRHAFFGARKEFLMIFSYYCPENIPSRELTSHIPYNHRHKLESMISWHILGDRLIPEQLL